MGTRAILVFHGYTMNSGFGAIAARTLTPIAHRVHVVAPGAPIVCTNEAVDRFYMSTGIPRPPGPYLTWWRASDDNKIYEGWDATLELVRRSFDEHAPIGIIGFSQGAMVAALVAALAARGELPPLRFAVLVAGRVPRAETLRPLLATPIDVPSLHVWGERDAMSERSAPELMQHFSSATRQSFVSKGGHTFPTSGPAADAITSFIESALEA
ncbi:MAG: hypothetical protein ACOY0T_02740 [Myxococcota bacterium]